MVNENPILTFRRKKNLTQAKLGAMLGVCANCVSRWETGDRIPRSAVWDRIRKVTGIIVNAHDFRRQ